MNYLTVILLGLALSIDSFGVGIAYGIKNIRISVGSIIAITVSSALAMTIAFFGGRLISGFFTNHMEVIIGGSILIAIGLWQLIEGWKSYQIDRIANDHEDPVILMTINLKFLGLMLQIILEPARADLDKSGEINFKEALLLGVALNIDAMVAGVGAGIAGYSVFLVPFVAISVLLSISLGLFIGKKYVTKLLGEKVYMLPGTILVCLGLFNLFR